MQAQTLDRGEMEELVQQAEEEEEEEEEEEDEELEEEIKVSRKKNKKKAKKQRVCKSICSINTHQCLAAIKALYLFFYLFFFWGGGGRKHHIKIIKKGDIILQLTNVQTTAFCKTHALFHSTSNEIIRG